MHYELKVSRSGEKISVLDIEAISADQAQSQALGLGYAIISIRLKKSFNIAPSLRGSRFNLLLFSQELSSLLKAGLSLVESMETLTEKNSGSGTHQVFRQIGQRLKEGQPFSRTLGEFPAVFPNLFIAMVQSSEHTGSLSQTLDRYVLYQTQLEKLKKKIVTASIYPALLIAVGTLVTFFLLGYVVPKFSVVYTGARAKLPMLSGLLIQWGNLLHAHTLIVGIGVVFFIIGLVFALCRSSVRAQLFQMITAIPALGDKLHIYQLARFYRTAAMLLTGGINLVDAMRMASDLLDPHSKASLAAAITQVREGKPLSHALYDNQLTTPVSLRMLKVGERTGEMGVMMERAAAFYDDEIERAVEWATRLFEPILMALIGLVIGLIVVLMYMPIFDLADAIQQ